MKLLMILVFIISLALGFSDLFYFDRYKCRHDVTRFQQVFAITLFFISEAGILGSLSWILTDVKIIDVKLLMALVFVVGIIIGWAGLLYSESCGDNAEKLETFIALATFLIGWNCLLVSMFWFFTHLRIIS